LIQESFAALFLLMLFGHALADYPLQGDFLARAKSRVAPLAGIPWQQALFWHSVIHGGFVGIVTGFWWLGVVEAAAHAVTDDLKCRGKITFNVDQGIHVACKALWAIIAILAA